MTAENLLSDNQDAALERLFDFLRIPSISTDASFADDCKRAADWLVSDLTSIGFDARTVTTIGHPFVVAHSPKIEGAPHVLFYGHYDVQPVDPLDLWDRDPFDPALIDRNGAQAIHGRGSSDDKGQVMTFIEACRALASNGGLPINISILIEGEEEDGSVSLPSFLEQYGDEVRADLVLVCDTGMVDVQTPAISSQLRGLMGEEVVIRAASTDLHSGLYGGAARNPAHVLTEILGALRDDNGRVMIDGFYSGVHEINDSLRADWAKLDVKGDQLLEGVGLSAPAGEEGYSVLEQLWARPTLEINGMISGYTGEGFKTVLPAEASAKLSMRLVGDQNPDALRMALRKFITDRLPPDTTVEFKPHGGSPAITMNIDAPAFQIAREAMTGIWPNDAVFVGMGGSIPIVHSFKTVLGMDSLLIGFALANDQIHAPNEKYNLDSFQNGALAWLRILTAFKGEKL